MSTSREGYLRVMLEGHRRCGALLLLSCTCPLSLQSWCRIRATGMVNLDDVPKASDSNQPPPMVTKIDNLDDESFDRSRCAGFCFPLLTTGAQVHAAVCLSLFATAVLRCCWQ